MLCIEYDVAEDGMIDLVALINAVDYEGEDPNGEAWLAWRKAHEDGGMGCAPVAPEDLRAMESTQDASELRVIVERVVMADRATKEEGLP